MDMIARTHQLSLELFCKVNDFRELYRAYSWRSDNWSSGFIDILRLEKQVYSHDRENGITLDDVKDIAKWGMLPNPDLIEGSDRVLAPNTFYDNFGSLKPQIKSGPIAPLIDLRKNIFKGIGPTYFSKILRFAAPRVYGAIDTRLVRVFGKGDDSKQLHDWLDLEVNLNDTGTSWFIPKWQEQWPSGYKRWLDILQTFSLMLPADCLHLDAFVEHGLRDKGVWTCADVEMALFTYASKRIDNSGIKLGQDQGR